MTITLTFDVERVTSTKAGHEFAAALVEHILETFNDDGSIDAQVSVVVGATAVHGGE